MSLQEYFESHEGVGVLSTADKTGKVNAAIYARPHWLDDGELVFIMRDRLSHANLQANPHAVFLFKENESYEGKRLYLTMTREEENAALIESLRRSTRQYRDEGENRFLVHFRLDDERPLVGDDA